MAMMVPTVYAAQYSVCRYAKIDIAVKIVAELRIPVSGKKTTGKAAIFARPLVG